jgi:hypothetical protein
MTHLANPQPAYKGTLVLNPDPMVAIYDDFVDRSTCEYVINLARNQMQPAKVSLDNEPGFIESRSNTNCWIHYHSDPVVKYLGQRVSDLVGIPLENAEALQVIHYLPNQEYRAHFDAYDLYTQNGQHFSKWGHQRIVTVLLYLNKVEEGGSTNFPKLNIDVSPKPGRIVIFNNVGESAMIPHPLSLHSGQPVIKGEKWACNLWFHARPMLEQQDFSEINK